VSLGRSGPGVRSGFLETPRTRFGGVFLASLADRVPVGRSRGFDASRPTPVRGCGCRSRVVRLSVPERLPGRHGPARALPSRLAGHGRERGAAARAVRRGVSGADFTRAKPSWPSPACEPPVRSEPAPAGRLLCAGCRRRRWGTQVETPPPPAPSAWPRQSETCRASGACDERRSILPWHDRRPHARRSPPLGSPADKRT
jgi:hypothetical protein